MSTETSPVTLPVRRRVARSGPTALIASVALVLWVGLGLWLALIAANSSVAGVVATVMFFASWLVVPGLAIAIIVFAIVALLFNPWPAKVMAALAIVLPVAVAALAWGSIGGFSEQFLP